MPADRRDDDREKHETAEDGASKTVDARKVDFAEGLRFGKFVWDKTERKASIALIFLILGSLTEGISILVMIPLLQLVSSADGAFSLTFPTTGWIARVAPGASFGLPTVLMALVGIVMLQALFNRYKAIYMTDLLHRFINKLRSDLVRSIARSRWGVFSTLRESDLNHVLTGDIDRVQAATYFLLLLLQSLVLLAIYLTVSLFVSLPMTLVAAGVGILMFAALRPLRRKSGEFGARLTINRQAQYRTVSEFLSGMKIAKSLNIEHVYVDRLDATLGRMHGEFRRFTELTSLSTAAFQVLSVVGLTIFMYVALVHVRLSLPEIIVMILLFMRLAPRFMDLQTNVQQIILNIPAFHVMEDTKAKFDRAVERVDGAAIGDAPLLDTSLVVRSASFNYGSDTTKTALRDVSFVLNAGTITAIVGPSGAGKSTIADLLLGLLEPTSGHLMVDGVTIDDANRQAWRYRVAYVPQDVFLLHDTIAANLRIAAPNAGDDELWAALGTAQAAGFIRDLPAQLETVVGDRGTRLSGGERQRIALARAMLRKPRLLVLDEATSALDGENQSLIARSVADLRHSMTIVTIAHRYSMVSFADHVIEIRNGEVVDSGSFTDQVGRPESAISRMLELEHGSAEASRAGG